MTEKVVLVDTNDNDIGEKEKLQAHIDGNLHRAISIFVFNKTNDKVLLQQRAKTKYHSPGEWTNTCCSHPRAGEAVEDAVHRRLKEEMGFDTDLEFKFKFIYKADVGKGLTEHELDHVYVGTYEGEIKPNPSEVESYKYISKDELLEDIKKNPKNYTPWFKIILNDNLEKIFS